MRSPDGRCIPLDCDVDGIVAMPGMSGGSASRVLVHNEANTKCVLSCYWCTAVDNEGEPYDCPCYEEGGWTHCKYDQHCCMVEPGHAGTCNSGQGHRSSEGDGGSCVFDAGAFGGPLDSMYNKESWVYQQLLAEGDMCSHCEAYRQAWTPEEYVRRPSGPPQCKATHEIADDRHTEDSTNLVSLSHDEETSLWSR